jgi:hypothetical protein
MSLSRILIVWLGVIGVLFSASVASVIAQKPTIKRVETVDNFRYEYEVLKADTSIRNGYFRFFYKNKLIEKGFFLDGIQSGKWQYYNLKGIFEYEYDYQNNKVSALAGNRDPNNETPCLFRGSPLIPYLFIVENLGYPKEARENNIAGKIVLALKINKKGEMWAYYLSEKLHPSLDAEVMRVVRQFPAKWQWLPATKFNEPIDSEYLITIEFELDDY